MENEENKRKTDNKPGPGRRHYISKDAKAKDFKKTFVDLLRYFKSYNILLVLAIISSILGVILGLVGPIFLEKITKQIEVGLASTLDFDLILKLSIILLIVYLLSLIFSALDGFIMATISGRLGQKMRNDIINKINKIPMKYFDKNTTGDILSRITNDVDQLAMNLNHSLTSLIESVIMLTGSIILMLRFNWILTFSIIGVTIFGLIIVFFIIKNSQQYFENQQKYIGEINGHIEEAFSGHTIIMAYSGEQKMYYKFNKINLALKKSTFMAETLSGIVPKIFAFIDTIAEVTLMIVGSILVLKSVIGVSIIVAFYSYIRYFTEPLTRISSLTQRLQIAIASAERVFEFLNEEELENEEHKEKNNKFTNGEIEFKNVQFGYEKGKNIIKNLTFKASAGEKIALVGPTGAGKTTIVNILMRFYEINGGNIYIDGVDTKTMTRKYIHDLFCMVLQDSWCFEGTIRENIVFSKKDIPDEKIIEACKCVGIHHFIMTLPKGYDTVLNESISLSGGQKQQLTIARAMVSDAPMLILDEATSSIDTKTEKLIQNSMDELMKTRTSFIIAHRLSTIKNADLILVIKEGDIIENGNHETLMDQKGFYYELYNSQFVEV